MLNDNMVEHIVINNDDIGIMSSYWLSMQFGGSKYKWTTLQHNGVMFPPEYEKHNVPISYKGAKIVLGIVEEEYATLYARYIDSEYVRNPVFRKNFWKDWRKVLGKDHIVQNLEDCDFREIFNYLVRKKEEKKENEKLISDQEKADRKKKEEKYKIAVVDGKEQKVGNYRMEPMGIFLGRGCNPNLGKVKKRIYPEDITVNIGKGEVVPEPLIGHKWGKIVHDRGVEWLVSWKDVITGKTKYVWLGAASDLKAASDMEKYDRARKLKRKIKTIRINNEIALSSNNVEERQVATALYFIDKFALRVGNEKGADEGADTVGVTSLRVEHIKLLNSSKVSLDFLGKDSVRYNRELSVDDKVYKNLEEFTNGKEEGDDLFDKIKSVDVNRYLQGFMKDLTAKVFRTYNASILFQKELKKASDKFVGYEESDKVSLLMDEFNKANAKVAVLCNHQKNVSKSTNQQLDKINEMIKKERAALKIAKAGKKSERVKKIEGRIRKLKAKKEMKIELKNISLGTSKINYIDPRITIAFLKKNVIPIEKIFSPTLQEKFKWAMEVDEDYEF